MNCKVIGISLDSEIFLFNFATQKHWNRRDFCFVPDPDPEFSCILDLGERIYRLKNNSINI